MSNSIRTRVDFNYEAFNNFRALQRRAGCEGSAELLRLALAVFDLVVTERQKGARVLVEQADGSMTEIDLSMVPKESP